MQAAPIAQGLPNLGATCYLNAVLQVLAQIPALRDTKTQSDSDKPDRAVDNGTIAACFTSWLRAYGRDSGSSTDDCVASLQQLIRAYGKPGMQDPHEFLIELLDNVHEATQELSVVRATRKLSALEQKAVSTFQLYHTPPGRQMRPGHCYTSVVSRAFTGQTRNKVSCVSCGYVSERFDPYRSWTLDIPQLHLRPHHAPSWVGHTSAAVPLSACLAETTKMTQLDSDNMYKCDQCKTKNRSVLQTSLWTAPQVMTLTLKRFCETATGIHKDQTSVAIPLLLDLGLYFAPAKRNNYHLIGVVHHTGTQHGGHCWATVRIADGQWLTIDDNRIMLANVVSEGGISGPTPYILFYSKNAPGAQIMA